VNSSGYRTDRNLAVVVGTTYVCLYSLPLLLSASQVWKQENIMSMSINKISVYGPLFCMAEKPNILTVRRISKACQSAASCEVSLVQQVTCPSWVWKWNIWKDKILCILATGQLAVWSMVLEVWLSMSDRYWELLYQNPAVMYRGMYICSSRTSQSLLEYWHCFPGDAYWLISTDWNQFQRYFPVKYLEDDVTAVCVQRRLIATATRKGELLLFEYTGEDEQIGSFWSSKPSLVVPCVSSEPLKSLVLGVTARGTTVVGRAKQQELVVLQWTPDLVSQVGQ